MKDWVDRLLADSLGLAEGEVLVVVSDSEENAVARAVASRMSSQVIVADESSLPASLPPCDVIVAASDQPLLRSSLRRRLGEAGVRVAVLRGASEEMLARCFRASSAMLRRRAERTTRCLGGRSQVRLAWSDGAELVAALDPSPPFVNCGDLRARGSTGYLPGGEVYLRVQSCDGQVVMDGSVDELGLLQHTVRVTIRNGRIVGVDGADEARWLERRLAQWPAEMARVTEIGRGINRHARLSGTAEDVKVDGMIHLGFGDDAFMGGDLALGLHWDAVFSRPPVVEFS